jgi:hypothetical protein
MRVKQHEAAATVKPSRDVLTNHGFKELRFPHARAAADKDVATALMLAMLIVAKRELSTVTEDLTKLDVIAHLTSHDDSLL